MYKRQGIYYGSKSFICIRAYKGNRCRGKKTCFGYIKRIQCNKRNPFETPFEPAAAYEFLKEFHEKYVIKKGDTVVVVMTGSGFYIAGRAVTG